MFHPIMPFFTEHLWHQASNILKNDTSKINKSEWPKGISVDEKDNITFDEKLKALTSRARIRTGEAIPYHIKSMMSKAVEQSNITYWMDDISAKNISVEEAKAKVEDANNTIMNLIEQGYNPADFHKNKKSFGGTAFSQVKSAIKIFLMIKKPLSYILFFLAMNHNYHYILNKLFLNYLLLEC